LAEDSKKGEKRGIEISMVLQFLTSLDRKI
jgi:hypothetical protein